MLPSCPRAGDRLLTAFETSSVVLALPPEPPPFHPLAADPMRRPPPAAPQAPVCKAEQRQRQGPDGDSDGVRFGRQRREQKQGRRAEIGQGRSGSPSLPTSPAPQPTTRGSGSARGLRGPRAAPRGTHLIRRRWVRSGMDRAWAPGLRGALRCRDRRSASRRHRPSPAGCAACAPAGRRVLPVAAGKAQRAGAQRSGERSAAAAHSGRGAARGYLCKADPAPDTDSGEAGRHRARRPVRARLVARRLSGCLFHSTHAEKNPETSKNRQKKENPW